MPCAKRKGTMHSRLADLFAKYMNQTGSAREIEEFYGHVNDPGNAEELKSLLGEAFAGETVTESLADPRASEILRSILADQETATSLPSRRHYPLWLKPAIAALVIITLSIGLYRYYPPVSTQKPLSVKNQPGKIQPGGDNALLTLADGSQIVLSSANPGEIARQPGISITKTGNGQITYTIHDTQSRGADTEPVYNTISTPRGGQYQVVLPDGSKVWLNAASSLRYPTFFAGGKRDVELDGEAYFEVAPDKQSPFIVRSAGQTVQVLGTHFNVNAYEDELVTRTTLLEGSVKVNNHLLVPGQQSRLNQKDFEIKTVDAAAETAWKNGEFVFNGEDLPSIMRMISRWYNVEVMYEYTPGDLRFGGEVSRSKNISDILHMLEATGDVRFRVEGRRVTVIK